MASLAQLIQSGDVEGVREHLAENPNATVEEAPSPLLLAVYHGQAAVAEAIRHTRPDLTLHEAAALGDVHQRAASLAKDPGGVKEFSTDGFSPLGYAAFFNHPSAAKLLLKAGADANVVSQNGLGVSPLHSALAGGHKELARMLFEAGGDVSAPSKAGWTPAHYAAHKGDLETARYLRARGAKLDAVNADGHTAAQIAHAEGRTELAELLS